jgi:hypothetical protein
MPRRRLSPRLNEPLERDQDDGSKRAVVCPRCCLTRTVQIPWNSRLHQDERSGHGIEQSLWKMFTSRGFFM